MTGLSLLLRRGLPTSTTASHKNAEFLGVADFIIVSMIGATLAVLVCTARSNHHGVAVYRECAPAGYRIAKLSGPNKDSGSSIERFK
jgi:hypothetical protein